MDVIFTFKVSIAKNKHKKYSNITIVCDDYNVERSFFAMNFVTKIEYV